jgi:hypothetical protein
MNVDDLHDDEAPLGSELGKLRDAYLTAVPRDGAVEVAQRAIIATEIVPIRATIRSRRRAAIGGLLSLGAVAVVVLAVAGRKPVVPAPQRVEPTATADSTESSIAVEVPEGRNAIVFATRNPLVSVVWIY